MKRLLIGGQYGQSNQPGGHLEKSVSLCDRGTAYATANLCGLVVRDLER